MKPEKVYLVNFGFKNTLLILEFKKKTILTMLFCRKSLFETFLI